MRLPWFQKPIYKAYIPVAAVTTLVLACLSIYYGMSILAPIGSLIIGTSILAVGAYKIGSGFYVTTICRGNKNNPKVAITFDDGPCEQTSNILDMLNKHGAKASFFVCGKNIPYYSTILQQMHKEGHSIGNHSYSHNPKLPLSSAKQILEDIELCSTELTKNKLPATRYFRPPYGVTNPNIAKALKKLNMDTIGWSIRSFDTVLSSEKVLKRVKKKLKNGSIILFHDTTKDIEPILEQVLIYCKQKGLQTVTLDNLIGK